MTLRDPLAVTTILAMFIVGAIVAVDIMQDGVIEPSVLALFVSVMAPLVPALIMRSRPPEDDEE